MSAYTTIAALSKRIDPQFLAELADDENATADISDATVVGILDQAITDASALIDSYLLGHWDMTASSNTAMAEPHCANIALYYLYGRQHHSHQDNPKAAIYEQTMAWLREAQKGRRHSSADPQRPGVLVTTNTTIGNRVFDSDSLDF